MRTTDDIVKWGLHTRDSGRGHFRLGTVRSLLYRIPLRYSIRYPVLRGLATSILATMFGTRGKGCSVRRTVWSYVLSRKHVVGLQHRTRTPYTQWPQAATAQNRPYRLLAQSVRFSGTVANGSTGLDTLRTVPRCTEKRTAVRTLGPNPYYIQATWTPHQRGLLL